VVTTQPSSTRGERRGSPDNGGAVFSAGDEYRLGGAVGQEAPENPAQLTYSQSCTILPNARIKIYQGKEHIMSVKYTVVAKANPQDREAPPKYYPSIKSKSKVTLTQIMEQVSAISTVSSVDIAAAVEALLNVIPNELAKGNTVQLGDFGSFSLRIQSTGADAEGDVTARNITKVLTTFRPGKRFKKVLASIDFEK
jgi:predicted histone-like DNA-binding protein